MQLFRTSAPDVIALPAESSDSAAAQSTEESKRAFKYPYVACEVFCCNSDSIMDAFLGQEELLSELFSALDLPRPLNCVLAGQHGLTLSYNPTSQFFLGLVIFAGYGSYMFCKLKHFSTIHRLSAPVRALMTSMGKTVPVLSNALSLQNPLVH